MHDGVNAFLSVRQPYIVDAARPPFVEKEMDHELLRQHVQLATVRVGQGNEARTLLAREGVWPGDYAVPLLFVRGAMAAYDGEAAHTRARRVLRSLSPFTGQEFCFDKTGYVDDVAGKAVGVLTAAAEQAVVRYEQHIARARSMDEGVNGAFPESASEEDPWAGAGLDEEEPEVRAGPGRGELRELVPPVEPHAVTAKHSVSVEAQVRALQDEAAAENDYIDRSMQALGMRQHAGKMENVLCIVGKGTRAVSAYLAQKGALMGSTLEASRYLGTRLTRTGTFSYERAVRLQATRAGWLQFGKYWQSRSPFRQRRSLFKGVVQGAALSGLETATGVKGPLTPGEVAPIDRLLVKFGRVLLRGTAKMNAEGGVRAVPNVVIWRKLRLVPTFHELRYRRVAWAQRLSENVQEHDAVLTGLLGQFAFENQSTVAEDGSLTDCANPWAQQLLADVLSLLFLESMAELRAEWDRSVLSLFGQFAEFFQKIDLNEARATHWSIAVSPGARKNSNENVEDVERPFKCLLVTERGQTCGLTFATWRGLTSHQRRPSGGTHGIRHLASLLTVTNACVLCGTTCKNKWAASDHLKRAIRHQRCVLDMTHAHVSLEPITSFSCPACYCSFGSATELQWHLRTHLEPYLTPGYLFVWPAHAVVVAGIGARALRGRTVAAAADQETARRHELSRYRYRIGSGWGRRRSRRAQAEVQAEEQGRGGRRRLQRSRPRVSGPLVGSKAPRGRGSDLLCRAGAEGDVFTLQKHEGGWQEVRAAGGSQGTTRSRSGQSAPPRVPGPPVRTGHVRASGRSRPSSDGQARGRQNVAGKGRRAPDAGRAGRMGHDVPSRGLLRQASAGEAGSHSVRHERNDGSVVAPDRSEASNPASPSWAAPTSRRNHDEADERTERARLALVRARWEAQGGGGPTRRESTSTRQVARTRPQHAEPSILLLLEGRTPAVPSRRGTPRRL